MKFSKVIFLFSFLAAVFTGCKYFHNDFQALDTELHLTVNLYDSISSSYQPAAGTTVYLYRSQADMEMHIAHVASGITGGDGSFTFKNLNHDLYYIYAYTVKGNSYYDNSTANFSLSNALIDNSITVASTQMTYKRVAAPSSFVIDGVQMIKYDSVPMSNCWYGYRFKLLNSSGITIDSTSVNFNNSPQVCYENNDVKLTPFPNSKSLAVSTYLINPFYLSLYKAYNGNSNQWNRIYLSTDGPSNPYNAFLFNLSDYQQGNTYGFLPYPTRIRVEGYFHGGGSNKDYIFDLILHWQ